MMRIILRYAALLLISMSAHSQELASAAPVPAATTSFPDSPTPNSRLDLQSPSITPPSSVTAGVAPAAPLQHVRVFAFSNLQSASVGIALPPQTPREKFITGFADSFGLYSILLVGAEAGIHENSNQYPAFRQGGAGYGRYYWHSFADQADENLWVISIIPAALHEDSRYYRLGRGKFLKRTIYALSRAVITRSDDGGRTVNVAEIVGAGASAGISTTYYPGQYRTWTKTGQRWLANVTVDGATFAVKEFWPDFTRVILRRHD
jgi:hypothetical protein